MSSGNSETFNQKIQEFAIQKLIGNPGTPASISVLDLPLSRSVDYFYYGAPE